MDQILAGVGSALAGFFGSPVVQFVIYSILAYLVVLWLASAYWVFRDMQQRTENAILPYLAASLVIVFLPVFPLAVFVYKIIRPHLQRPRARLPPAAHPRRQPLAGRLERLAERPGPAPRRRHRAPAVLGAVHEPVAQRGRLLPRRARLVAVRLVRQGLRAAGHRDRIVGGAPRGDLAAARGRGDRPDRSERADSRDRGGSTRRVAGRPARPNVAPGSAAADRTGRAHRPLTNGGAPAPATINRT